MINIVSKFIDEKSLCKSDNKLSNAQLLHSIKILFPDISEG